MCDVCAAQYKEQVERYKALLCDEEGALHVLSDNPLAQGN